MLNLRRTVVAALLAGAAAIDGKGDQRPGVAAAFTEEGYMQVASQKSDEKMKTYIRRLLDTFHREVADEGQLNGFARFYSGTEAVQSYARLAEELHAVPWVKDAGEKMAEGKPVEAKPVVQESKPKPVFQESKPKPAVQESKPKPVVQESKPKPIVQESKPKPVAAKPAVQEPKHTNHLRASRKAVANASVAAVANASVASHHPAPQPVKVTPHTRAVPQVKEAKASPVQHARKAQEKTAPTAVAKVAAKPAPAHVVKATPKAEKSAPVSVAKAHAETATHVAEKPATVPVAKAMPKVGNSAPVHVAKAVANVTSVQAVAKVTSAQAVANVTSAQAVANVTSAQAVANVTSAQAVAKVTKVTNVTEKSAPALAAKAVDAMPAPKEPAKVPEVVVVPADQTQALLRKSQPPLKREEEEVKSKLNYTMIKGVLKGMELPEVDAVMHKASDTLEDFAAQAKFMQSRVVQQQAASRAALADQKRKYEAKLGSEVKRNNMAKAANEQLTDANNRLQADNQAAEKVAEGITESSDIMRLALDKLRSKMDVAMAFIEDSVNVTDDRDAEDLAVLRPTTPAPSLDYFLGLARAELGLASNTTKESAPLFLQLEQATSPTAVVLPAMAFEEGAVEAAERRMKEGHATAEDLVPLLSRSLSKISTAEAAGITAMKEKFDTKHEVNEKRYAELLQTQKELEESGAALLAKKVALKDANAKLSETRESLFQRLRGFQVFALKVDEAMAETLRAADDVMA